MDPLSKEQVLEILWRDNPGARADDISMYADCFCDYQEAVANIMKNGNIVAHPRTGSPMENPFMRVKLTAMAALQKMRRVKRVDALWRAVQTGAPEAAL